MAGRNYRRRKLTAPAGQHLTGGLFTHDSQGNIKPRVLGVSKSAPENLHSEHLEQSAFYSQIATNAQRAPELTRFRANPNGGWRGEKIAYKRKDGATGFYSPVGRKLQAEGVKAGVLDNLCPIARRGYHSLWLEFKVNKGDLEPEQREERELLIAEGHCVHTVWTWVEAWHIAIWYLSLDPASLLMPSRHAVLDMRRGHDERCGCDYLRVRELPSWDWRTPSRRTETICERSTERD
jgi:hypothetical protein